MKVIGILSILLTIFKDINCDSYQENAPSLYCTDLTPQTNVDINEVRKRNRNSNFFLRSFHSKATNKSFFLSF